MKSRDQQLLEEAYRRVMLTESGEEKMKQLLQMNGKDLIQWLKTNYPNWTESDSSKMNTLINPKSSIMAVFASLQSLKDTAYEALTYKEKTPEQKKQFNKLIDEVATISQTFIDKSNDSLKEKIFSQRWESKFLHIFKTGKLQLDKGNKLKVYISFDPFVPNAKKMYEEVIKMFLADRKLLRQMKCAGELRSETIVMYLSPEGEREMQQIYNKIKNIGKTLNVEVDLDHGKDYEIDFGGTFGKEKYSSNEMAGQKIIFKIFVDSYIDKNALAQKYQELKTFAEEWPPSFLSNNLKNGAFDYLMPKSKQQTPAPQPQRTTGDKGDTIALKGETGQPIIAKINTTFGRDSIKGIVGDDSKFFSPKQFSLIKSNKEWTVENDPSATNLLNLNGVPVTQKQKLKNGDNISLGKTQKGKIQISIY